MTVTDMNAQNKTDFESKMQQHIQSFLTDNQKVEKWKKENTTPFIKLDPTENEDMLNNLVTELKHNFIIANMDEYNRAYFPEEFVSSRVLTDTFICDNGGFESDFLYYKGYSTIYNSGSTTCTPTWLGNPSVYIPSILPTIREFEIVTSGTDAITGIQKVKFGSKALKLNDVYHHSNGGCTGDRAINKIVKRFKVNEENRDFTVWYSFALENPSLHSNTQPFFNISCDLAPLSELCFDAAILDCDSTYAQPGCSSFLMDVLDWTCHRIKIPASEIGNIATLEIVMADCAETGHNGYAYIDGICEECTGSALGSLLISDEELDYPDIGINYVSCDRANARICGSYTEPFVCGEWYLDSIDVPGYTITNVSIDTLNNLFCFNFDTTNFDYPINEIEIYVAGFFKREGGGSLPVVFSNSIVIEKSLYIDFDVSFTVGDCFPNSDPDDHNISDDYYFVQVAQNLGNTEPWRIERHLLDPYPNESGITTLATGNGPFAVGLGPFLIQEGSWELVVTIDTCTYNYTIYPPEYCSGCEAFRDVVISNVICETGNTWSFSIEVPGSSSTGTKFKLFDPSNTLLINDYYNTSHSIDGGLNGFECLNYKIEEDGNPTCFAEFTVCPPKPCETMIDCDLEVVVSKIECSRQTTNSSYYITLNASNGNSYTMCYTVNDVPGSGNNSAVPYNGIIGPFTGDQTIVVFLCPGGVCTLCLEPECYKVIKVYQPDCEEGDFGGVKRISSNEPIINKQVRSENLVKIIPNPVGTNKVSIVSQLAKTTFEIFDSKGQKIWNDSFTGGTYQWEVSNLPSGNYVLQYVDEYQQIQRIQFIKL